MIPRGPAIFLLSSLTTMGTPSPCCCLPLLLFLLTLVVGSLGLCLRFLLSIDTSIALADLREDSFFLNFSSEPVLLSLVVPVFLTGLAVMSLHVSSRLPVGVEAPGKRTGRLGSRGRRVGEQGLDTALAAWGEGAPEIVLRGVPGSPVALTGLEYLEGSSLLSLSVGWLPMPLLLKTACTSGGVWWLGTYGSDDT